LVSLKKIVFYCFLTVLASFLLTCKNFSPDEFEDEVVYTDVVYSPDGNSLTVYLEGTVPVSRNQSRALNLELAKLGHDFFEVAFAYNHGGNNYTIARAAWETGHSAGVKGIYRPAAGVDYSQIRQTIGTGQASAVIFVGKKSDKTLLAVGKLAYIDKTSVDEDPKIYAATKTVTFEVAALKGGASFTAADSTFKTAASGLSPSGNYINTNVGSGTTRIVNALIGRTIFPAFTFPLNSLVRAQYDISAVDADILLDGYLNGIIVTAAGTVAKTTPRFPLGSGGHETSSAFFDPEEHTGIDFELGNQTVGSRLNNNIRFTFSTQSGDNGKVGAFWFEIPVCPLLNAGDPGEWFIRPGYDSYLYDLDDGNGGTGGAVLFGIGDLVYLEYGLYITKQPDKINYSNGTPASPGPPPVPAKPNDYLFNPSGLIAYMQTGNYRVRRVDVTDLTFWVGTGQSSVRDFTHQIYYEAPLGPTNLTTYFDDPPAGFGSNGMLIITARYIDESSVVYYDDFVVYRSELGGIVIGDVPHDQRYIITSGLDVILLYNRINQMNQAGYTGPRSIVIVSYYSFDLNLVNLNGTGYVFIVMAAAPDLVFGLQSGGGFYNHDTNNNAFFFGVWPFNEPFSVDGMAIDPQPYTINAAGSYLAVTGGTAPVDPSASDGFIRGITSGITVRTGPVNVINPYYFIRPGIPSWP
jgi:hypothetical protein